MVGAGLGHAQSVIAMVALDPNAKFICIEKRD